MTKIWHMLSRHFVMVLYASRGVWKLHLFIDVCTESCIINDYSVHNKYKGVLSTAVSVYVWLKAK